MEYDMIKDIVRLNVLINKYFQKITSKLGLSIADAHILIITADNEGVNQEFLAKELGISKNVVTQKLNKIIKLDYITKTEDSEDRRNNKLYITDKGKALMIDINKELKIANEFVLSKISDFDTMILENNIRIIINSAKKIVK
ncbi:MAG: MarR family winged helix-turn-helix transcriptional regulator [Bacilli bacterium]|jgi:DNA-binding MarR family transcriptional regulator|nr:MarR family winged helix-turn-helix transcriptional regulator [Bacilli bacterium]